VTICARVRGNLIAMPGKTRNIYVDEYDNQHMGYINKGDKMTNSIQLIRESGNKQKIIFSSIRSNCI
jgi:hypothetical protein